MNDKYDNSGALFKNDKRESEGHPHYTGKITVAGVDYWLSAWIKEGQKGKWMSLAVREKERTADNAPKREPAPRPSVDEDVPF